MLSMDVYYPNLLDLKCNPSWGNLLTLYRYIDILRKSGCTIFFPNYYIAFFNHDFFAQTSPTMDISRSRALGPMYLRIEQEILDQIKSGRLPSGSQIPSETDLAKNYNVSRITAKRVLDDLVQLGRAYRKQGKGTFVCPERIREISGFRSFSDDMLALGFHPTSSTILFEEIEPTADIQERLMIKASDRAFILKRLRFADEEPVAIETAYLPSYLFPGLLSENLNLQSLYATIKNKYHLFPVWADAEIEAGSAEKEVAFHLKIKKGDPVLIARRRTYTESFTIIESATSIYRGDRFTFSLTRQIIG